MQARKDGDAVRLWSRNGRDWSAEFVAITAAVMALPVTRIVLDGEAVAHCPEGLPDFHALLSRSGAATACLYAFDLLRAGADDLRAWRSYKSGRCLSWVMVKNPSYERR